MNTWMLKTDDDPLSRVRTFLKAIWDYAQLDGMVIPRYQTDRKSVKQTVIYHPDSLPETGDSAELRAIAGRRDLWFSAESPLSPRQYWPHQCSA